MGCVRDLIHLEKFYKNLVEFQRSTQAKINVVSYDKLQSHWVMRTPFYFRTFWKIIARNKTTQEHTE